jgi:DNA-binding FadR family transcriptional regulator
VVGQSLMSDQSHGGSERGARRNRSNLHERLRDRIGQDIVAGRLAPGTIIKAEELREPGTTCPLSVVREVVRVIESLGMLRPIRRVRLVVLAMDEWTLLDPLVIRWRMTEAPARQLRSLTELRVAIEPEAAGLAAQHAPRRGGRGDHGGLAARMRSSGRKGDVEAFLTADVAFPPGGARRRRQTNSSPPSTWSSVRSSPAAPVPV